MFTLDWYGHEAAEKPGWRPQMPAHVNRLTMEISLLSLTRILGRLPLSSRRSIEKPTMSPILASWKSRTRIRTTPAYFLRPVWRCTGSAQVALYVKGLRSDTTRAES